MIIQRFGEVHEERKLTERYTVKTFEYLLNLLQINCGPLHRLPKPLNHQPRQRL